MANLADAHGAFQDEISDELGKKGASNVRGHAFDNLRRNLRDVVVGRARQAVLVADAIVHDGKSPGEVLVTPDFISADRLAAPFTVTFRLTFSAST
jgi:hypothetical protein